MTALSEYLQSRVQKAFFHGQTLELPSNISIALTTDLAEDSQDGSSIPEVPESISRSGVIDGVSGVYDYETGYSRLDICIPQINGTDHWAYTEGGNISNVKQLVFDTCREAWGTVSGIAVLDSDVHGSGNLLFHGELEEPRRVLKGDAPKFDATVLEICLS